MFQYVEGLNQICRHASNKHKAKSSSRQTGKVSLSTVHQDISITFALASPSDHKAATV